MESLDATLARSRQIEEKYKKFKQQQVISDLQWIESEKKLEKTLSKVQQAKKSVKEINELYDNFQKAFDNLIVGTLNQIEGSKLLEMSDPDFKPSYLSPEKFKQLIEFKDRVIIITGAGISVASGIPTFRGNDGYWTKKKEKKIDPEVFLTLTNFKMNQIDIWEWLDDFYNLKLKSQYNRGHQNLNAICQYLVQKRKKTCIVTQNIDNFHREVQKQEIYPIYEIHGNIQKVRCDSCQTNLGSFYPYKQFREQILEKRSSPKCPKCNNNIRPHIMFFDEFYTEKYNHSDSIVKFLQNDNEKQTKQVPKTTKSDLLIVIGTTLQTGLVRNLVQRFIQNGQDVIQINTQCLIRQKNTYWMEGKSDQILCSIHNVLMQTKQTHDNTEISSQQSSKYKKGQTMIKKTLNKNISQKQSNPIKISSKTNNSISRIKKK